MTARTFDCITIIIPCGCSEAEVWWLKVNCDYLIMRREILANAVWGRLLKGSNSSSNERKRKSWFIFDRQICNGLGSWITVWDTLALSPGLEQPKQRMWFLEDVSPLIQVASSVKKAIFKGIYVNISEGLRFTFSMVAQSGLANQAIVWGPVT